MSQVKRLSWEPMQFVVAALLVAMPWLNPAAFGPSPAVLSFLVSWLCFAVLLLLQAKPDAKVFSSGWLIAGVASSILGLFQYFDVAQHLGPWVSQAEPGEAFANLRQRNQFATLTNLGLMALLWSAERAPLQARTGKTPWIFFVMATVLAGGNAASSSRTGLVQLGLLVIVAWLWGWLRDAGPRRALLFAALLSYVVASLSLPTLAGLDTATTGIVGRLQDGTSTCAGRVTLWSNILHLISQKPWLGWGWGELDYAHYMAFYQDERFCDILNNAHNLPLHVAVELGIPAAVLFCGGLGWLVLRAKPWRETDPGRQLAWGVLAVIGLHSMLEYPLWYGPFQVAAGLCLALLWATPPRNTGGAKEPALMAPAARAALAVIVMAGVAYAAWDYHRITQIYLAPQARDAAYRDDTMNKARESWLFRDQVTFAELTTTPLTRDNAEWTFNTATALLHYSPEPRVIEKVIESAVMLGHDEDALLHLMRYRAAFPRDYEKWRNVNAMAYRQSP